MKSFLKVTIFTILMTALASSYALNIKVKSTSKKITGLGFTVNGEEHGGLGSNYSASDMPKGTYQFGLRAGKNISCSTKEGKKKIKIVKNTNAILKLSGKKCTLILK